ncbi:MAG: M4 family metallopeptidase [Candidatus Limivivens sp.]|nr:M4 family metallopeptidase [Candidatus Limivivens sp.]
MEKSLFHATSVLAAAVCVSIFLFLHAKVYANDQTEKEYNTAFQLTEEKIQEMNNGKAVILYDENGYLSFLDGIFYDQPVRDYDEAIQALNGVASLLGISKGCEFYAVYGASDSAGYTYLVYKQRYGNITIENATLKIVLNPQGYPCLLSCSFAREIGMDSGEDGITAEQAENKVRAILWKENPEILEDYTRQTSVLINGIAYHAWEVYTYNMNRNVRNSRPYLKYIILYDGTYYKALQVSSPEDYSGQDAASSGDAELFFEKLIPAVYTGKVTLHDGTEKTLTVDVGYDAETGGYYLADKNRKIAVADFAARAYKNQYELEWTEDNTGWDDKILITYSTYCRVYDYFKSKGMNSIDGFGIPLLILSGYCESDGTPIDNACFMGIQDGWGLFAASDINDYGEAVDVIAHEYTHGIREYSLGGDLYENRTGAIHEAYSDILGNICEMELGATEDPFWKIGETCGRTLRNMSSPNDYYQPSFYGDRFFMEETDFPSEQNDQGGVHINSGILGNIAFQIAEMGLGYEEQYWLWMKSDEILTPLSDYDDICAALMFVSRINGYPTKVTEGIFTSFANALVLARNNSSLWKESGESGIELMVDPGFLDRIAGLSVENADSGEVIRRVQGEADGQFSVRLPAGCYHAALLIYANEKTRIEAFYYDDLGRWVIDAEQADRLVLDDGRFMVLNSPN